MGEGWEQKRDNGSRQGKDVTNWTNHGRSPFKQKLYIKRILYSHIEKVGERLSDAHWKHIGKKYGAC